MRYCDLTLGSPAENLACDEALLDLCEEGLSGECLRFWEPTQYFVVAGYANRADTEVNLLFCQEHAIPVLRRCTGGGTVLQGPGCLNYSLCLRIEPSTPLHSIPGTNDFILERHRQALSALLGVPVEKRGQTDLAIGQLKFCGNAQRRKRQFLIFHGSFLLRLDLELMEKVLPLPSKQPAYRANRAHSDFLTNLNISDDELKRALVRAWNATQGAGEIPRARIEKLVQEKYGRSEWNLKFY